MSALAGFNVMASPCVLVRFREDVSAEEVAEFVPGAAAGEVARVGVRQALKAAHLVADLQVEHVAVEAALRRFLTALAVRVGGLDVADEDVWQDVQQELLLAGRFDAGAVDDYVKEFGDRFDLYSDRPLLQDPRLAQECTTVAVPGRLAMTRPSGNTQPWRSRVPQEEPVASAEAFGWLLAWRDYGPCGTEALRSHGGKTTKMSKAGPNRRVVSYFPLGSSLFTSLVLGCPPPGRWPQLPGEDLAPWEREGLPDPLAPVVACGPVSLLAGRAAHAVLLAPGEGGEQTVSCWIAWATQEDLPAAVDPFTMTTPEGRARLANAGRSLLRDFDSLVHARDVSAGGRVPSMPPVWLGAFADLAPKVLDAVSNVWVRVLGCQQAAQAGGMEHWWSQTTPVAVAAFLPSRHPGRAALVARARQAAEDAAESLGGALRAAWRETGGDPKHNPWTGLADMLFWDRAEEPFWAAVTAEQLPAEDRQASPLGFRRLALQVYDEVSAPQTATVAELDLITAHRRAVISPRGTRSRKAEPVTTSPASAQQPAAAEGRPDPLLVFNDFMRLVAKICTRSGGRGALADGLAYDLSEGAPPLIVEELLNAEPDEEVHAFLKDDKQARLFTMIACLYAFHDAPNPRTAGEYRFRPPRPGFARHNLGWSYHEAIQHGIRAANARAALRTLAGGELDDLVLALPGAISWLCSKKAPVAWSVLLRDLTRWNRHAEQVRREWFQAFHPITP
ncbi:type I-E CRISPR-associated protein Cse1/CasA [Kitasatospora sp. NRRL B-11411]|uniref:type I-E CRISPR-associated protein Cse1/CasA n=1 Tax=Kitasatospora sp. NRRL B-11411 TaxID=1463822 RepID=UPI0005696BDD|nr:type I-E CRISPR-associated protein Cse1/CasA [Kitasatospora sp. NRRL B-11411]